MSKTDKQTVIIRNLGASRSSDKKTAATIQLFQYEPWLIINFESTVYMDISYNKLIMTYTTCTNPLIKKNKSLVHAQSCLFFQ